MCVLKEIPLASTFKRQAVRRSARDATRHTRAPHRVDRETKRDDYGDGPYESITINLPVDLAGSLGNLCHLSGLSVGVKQRRRRIALGPLRQDAKLDTRTGIFYPRYHYSLVDT